MIYAILPSVSAHDLSKYVLQQQLNIISVAPQVSSEEGRMYTGLTPTFVR